MPELAYNDMEQDLLLQTAADSIDYGLLRHEPFPVVVNRFPAALQESGACFVTLRRGKELRGCIGSTHAYRPLIVDVAENAFAASRRDPRFAPLTLEELPEVSLSLSILTRPEPMTFRDEDDLLAQLVPGEDGLIIEDQGCRATFLPQVWEQLPAGRDFLAQLKRKAGLDPGHGSPTLAAQRYRVFHIGAPPR